MAVSFGILKVASRPDFTIDRNKPLGRALVLHPGEDATILSIKPTDSSKNGVPLKITSMGVTQHPGTAYTYDVDGKQITSPAPIGTFIHPLYTCRDLGQYIEVKSQFSIMVKNNGTEAHRYVAQVIYLDAKVPF